MDYEQQILDYEHHNMNSDYFKTMMLCSSSLFAVQLFNSTPPQKCFSVITERKEQVKSSSVVSLEKLV